jgi:hypothetical protein
MADAGLRRQRSQHGAVGGTDDCNPRPRVAQEEIHFVRRIGHIDGHEYGAEPQTRHVQQYGLRALVYLDGNAIAAHHPPIHQGGCISPRMLRQRGITQHSAAGGPEEKPVRLLDRG